MKKNDEILISIVIPVYNVEEYLEQCIKSVINQTYKNIEVILVDDGSPDNCPHICDSYFEKDKRIRVIHKSNGGLSDARNVGIEESTGEYIMFLDSDDYWEDSNALYDIATYLNNENPDLVILNSKKYYEENDKKIIRYDSDSKIEGDWNNLVKHNIYKACAWDKVVKSRIIKENKIYFPLNTLSEDIEWCGKLINYSRNIVVYNNPFYVYRQRRGSITKTIKANDFINVYNMFKDGVEYANTNLSGELKNIYLSYFAYEYSVYLGLISKTKNMDKCIKEEFFSLKYLLKFRISDKVKKVSILNRIFGIKITSLMLSKYIKYKE